MVVALIMSLQPKAMTMRDVPASILNMDVVRIGMMLLLVQISKVVLVIHSNSVAVKMVSQKLKDPTTEVQYCLRLFSLR